MNVYTTVLNAGSGGKEIRKTLTSRKLAAEGRCVHRREKHEQGIQSQCTKRENAELRPNMDVANLKVPNENIYSTCCFNIPVASSMNIKVFRCLLTVAFIFMFSACCLHSMNEIFLSNFLQRLEENTLQFCIGGGVH